MSEKGDLCAVVDLFAEAMKRRLLNKQKTGHHGWQSESASSFNSRLFVKTTIAHTQGDIVKPWILLDVANLAMFVWWHLYGRRIKR